MEKEVKRVDVCKSRVDVCKSRVDVCKPILRKVDNTPRPYFDKCVKTSPVQVVQSVEVPEFKPLILPSTRMHSKPSRHMKELLNDIECVYSRDLLKRFHHQEYYQVYYERHQDEFEEDDRDRRESGETGEAEVEEVEDQVVEDESEMDREYVN